MSDTEIKENLDMESAGTADENTYRQIYPIIAFVTSIKVPEDDEWKSFVSYIGNRYGNDDSGNLFINLILNLSRYKVTRSYDLNTHISLCGLYVNKINEFVNGTASDAMLEGIIYGLAYRTFKFENYDNAPEDEIWKKSITLVENYCNILDTIEESKIREFYAWSIYNIALQLVAFASKVTSPTVKNTISLVGNLIDLREYTENFRIFADSYYNGEFKE